MTPNEPLSSANDHMEPIDVLYIIGSGRSGSTLLGNVLGTQPDFVNVGEIYNLRQFFDSVEQHDRYCSCGAKLNECPYWKAVIAHASIQAGTTRLDPKLGDTATLIDHNHALLSAIRDVSGKRIIIDSSKRLTRLNMLMSSPKFRVTVLHLVRDGRAFAYSAMTSSIKRNLPHTRYFFRRLLKWQNKNIAIRILLGHRENYHLIRYEELVSNPVPMLDSITGWYGLSFDHFHLEKTAAALVHEFSGNSDFISRKSLEIRHDTRYIQQLDTSKWVLGTMLAAAGLRLFRYPFRRRVPRT